MGWLYVPGSEDWNSESELRPEMATVALATANRKVSRRPVSWFAWKKRPWIKPLLKTILNPSMAKSTAEKWISSQPDSHASLGQTQEKGKRQTIADGSGQKSTECFAKWDPKSYSWKTSQGSLLGGWDTFSETWPRSGSMENGMCFHHAKSARRTYVKGYSSWPTPLASDGMRGGNDRKRDGTPSLRGLIRKIYGPETVQSPMFTEALMGLPIGWTASEQLETPFLHWLQLMRSELSRLERG